MNPFVKIIFTFLILVMPFCKARGQGCSDAGFCTAGSIKPSLSNPIHSSIGLSLGYGMGERKTHIISTQFEPQIKVNAKSMVQIKLPFIYISGNVAKTQGLGDAVLTYNYLFDSLLKYPVIMTLGTRIASGTAALKSENIPLPMPYQISLGTTDFIVGVKMELPKGFSFSIAYQQPLFNRNQNGFDSTAFRLLASNGEKYGVNNDKENYFISSHLERKGDILLRIDKSFKIKREMVSIGILPIYHLGNDEVTINKQKVEVKNSSGLTLNLNGGFYHRWDNNVELSVLLGSPLIVRESRPDGLTRAIVVACGLRYFY